MEDEDYKEGGLLTLLGVNGGAVNCGLITGCPQVPKLAGCASRLTLFELTSPVWCVAFFSASGGAGSAVSHRPAFVPLFSRKEAWRGMQVKMGDKPAMGGVCSKCALPARVPT